MNRRRFKNWLDRNSHSIQPGDAAWLKKAANGDVDAVWYAFTWYSSPQGEEHWHAVWEKRKKLSKRSRSFIAQLYAAAVARGC